MKSTNYLLILSLILTVSFSYNSKAQEIHTIILSVDTGKIVKQRVDDHANFGQATGISNRDLTIHVRKGDIVVWRGVSSSAPNTDIVSISSINHEGGKNVFNKNILKGNGDTAEIVTATVVNGIPGDEQKYKVSFKVIVNGTKKNGTFHIDPKIIVNQ